MRFPLPALALLVDVPQQGSVDSNPIPIPEVKDANVFAKVVKAAYAVYVLFFHVELDRVYTSLILQLGPSVRQRMFRNRLQCQYGIGYHSFS